MPPQDILSRPAYEPRSTQVWLWAAVGVVVIAAIAWMGWSRGWFASSPPAGNTDAAEAQAVLDSLSADTATGVAVSKEDAAALSASAKGSKGPTAEELQTLTAPQ